MPLSEAFDQLMRQLYLAYGIPSDQYERRPAECRQFVASWNELSSRSDSADEVMHYIITRRKRSKWVRFEGAHKRLDSMPKDFLSDAHWLALREAYTTVLVSRGLGSDNIRFDAVLATELANEFKKLSGRTLPSSLLLAAIEAKRKRGEWLKLKDSKGIGFSDIDEVA